MRRFLSEFEPLLPAEREYLDKLAAEDWDAERFVLIGDGNLPDGGDAARTLRAEFVRFLALGGGPGARPPETGLRLRGALIEGEFSVEACRDLRDIELIYCRFDAAPIFRGASVNLLILNGSEMPGLKADRIETRGGVFLDGAVVRGEARLGGARLGGNLDCDGARLERPEGVALDADSLETRASVFLRGAKVRGEARLRGTRVGGNLECIGASFERPKGAAMSLDGARVAGTLFLRPDDAGSATRIDGVLDLTAAEIGAINDRESCWPKRPGQLRLDRCRYGAFTGPAPVDSDARLRWLALHDPSSLGADFHPQPYEQLAKVLRETGHAEDAREVLIVKEAKQRAARRARAGRLEAAARLLWDGILAATVDYGLRPLKALVWMLALLLLGWGIFQDAADLGAIKPNNAFILRSPEWAFCAHPDGETVLDAARNPVGVGRGGDGETQIDCFGRQPEAASFPRFSALAYSADTLFPLVDLEMQDHWIPDESKPDTPGKTSVGAGVRVYLWLHIALGWFLSLLAVAGLSGIVRSD